MSITFFVIFITLLIAGLTSIGFILKLQNQQAQYRLEQALLKQLSEHHIESLKNVTQGLQQGREEQQKSLQTTMYETNKALTERVEKLTESTNQRLKEISGQVEKRLNEGFEKTNQTFVDIVKRLALIDEAQKKISELSGNVVSLKELLADKRSRGAFGEVQLSALIRNMLPENTFSFQHTLSNDKRADCMLFLPEPTGNIAIDAKFPLESYQVLADANVSELERQKAQQQFRRDIKKHIQDIAGKYILPGETTDGAVMFIPAEAIFAEIHAHYPDLVEASHQAKVWLASPTTMMAILTTIRAVLKDDATRKQVHIIQDHLRALSQDFGRFQKRMDGLQRHIEQAHNDVKDVHISARKISSRFEKIDQVELPDTSSAELMTPKELLEQE